MSFQPGAMVYSQAYGSRPENVEVPHLDVRAPTATDTMYPVGKDWIDQVGLNAYTLVGQTSIGGTLASVWNLVGTNTGALNTLTGGSGGAISPSAGNITLAGTGSQITTTGSGSTITFSLPAAITTPGSLTTTSGLSVGTTLGVTGASTLAATTIVGTTNINATGAAVTTIGTGGTGAVAIGNATGNTAVTGSLTTSTSITATLGNITLTNGNLVLVAAGNKINHTSVGTTTAAGANSIGSVTLVSGTATVSTTNVTASSLIKLWRQSIGSTGAAALGELVVGTISAGASFVINAASITSASSVVTTDVSVVGWEIVN